MYDIKPDLIIDWVKQTLYEWSTEEIASLQIILEKQNVPERKECQQAKILKSHHSEVYAGDIGIVHEIWKNEMHMPYAYTITIEKQWRDMTTQGTMKHEIRNYFFQANEIELIDDNNRVRQSDSKP